MSNQFQISGRVIPCTNSMAAGESGIVRNNVMTIYIFLGLF